jgi:hypothetical protein
MAEIGDRSKSGYDDSSQLNGLVGSQRGSNRCWRKLDGA